MFIALLHWLIHKSEQSTGICYVLRLHQQQVMIDYNRLDTPPGMTPPRRSRDLQYPPALKSAIELTIHCKVCSVVITLAARERAAVRP